MVSLNIQHTRLGLETRRQPINIRPALRDRLVEANLQYFATRDFSIYFRRHYKFSWPFSFEDAYIYCKDSNNYRLSPIFERYHRDLKNWGVEKPFLQKFPELAQDISLCHSDADPSYPLFHRIGVVIDIHEDAANAGRRFSVGLTEPEIMGLFNEYPQVT